MSLQDESHDNRILPHLIAYVWPRAGMTAVLVIFAGVNCLSDTIQAAVLGSPWP